MTSWTDLYEGSAGVSDRLDKEAGILKNVLVCGLESPNCPKVPNSKIQPTKGTRYTLDAFRNAVPLYEGVKVRVANRSTHRLPAAQFDRHPVETIGVLRNVRVVPEGLRADFHYDRFHSFTPSLVEDVERKFGRWGLSHVASGGGPVEDGWLIVKYIPHVRGVDLVDGPATTVSLLENKDMADAPVKIKFSELCETLIAGRKVKGKKLTGLVTFMESDAFAGKRAADGVTLTEDDMGAPMGEMPVDAPTSDDPEEALISAFLQACTPLLKSALGGDVEALKKLNEWIKAHVKLAAGGDKADSTSADTSTPPPDTAESKSAKAVEAELRLKLSRYENKTKVAELAESLGCKDRTALPPTLIDGLAEMSESRWAPIIKDYVKSSRGPRSSGPATLPYTPATTTPAAATDGKDFAKKITG